jgi:hypothetical protein
MGFPLRVPRELELCARWSHSRLSRQNGYHRSGTSNEYGRERSVKVGASGSDHVNGDPLKEIRNIRNVWMVIKEGQQYDPVALHKMVGFLR